MRIFFLTLCVAFSFSPIYADEPAIQWFYNLPPNDNPDEQGLRSHFVEQIDLAKDSIDGAFYQINDSYVVEAMLRAAERGVEVVLTTDSDWVDHPEYVDSYQKLIDGGVTVIPDERRPLHHDKYCIIDRNLDRARVWMGSYNITLHGSVENGDAAFLIIDPRVAQTFYADFKQMAEGKFQSNKGGVFLVGDEVSVVEDTVNPAGLDWRDFEEMEGTVSYPAYEIEGTPIEFYFLPHHNAQRKVIEAIYSARESIHFAAYTLDNPMIYQALINKAATDETHSPYNIYPVALRQDPWENLTKTLRVARNDGATFAEEIFSDETWDQWQQDYSYLFGNENEGLFYNAARYFYPDGPEGGEIRKVPVYGVMNWLGLSKGPYAEMIEKGLAVRKTALPGNLHSKFIVIDRETLLLGSYNFSTSAEKKNDETLIIIRDPEIVENFYQAVFRPVYMNAYPEYVPTQEELDEFSYDRKAISISEIHFIPQRAFSASKFVEVHNDATCETEEECEALTVDLTGWKLWNGVIPTHEVAKMKGKTDTLISYYNDPYTNKSNLNDPTKGYFLKPELQTLKPGEYGLIVGRDFDLDYLESFLDRYHEHFREIYGRDPQESYEMYPKLFVSSRRGDSAVGDGLKPYQFLTLFYPDQFTIADRFDHNLSFRDEERSDVDDLKDLLNGNTDLKLALKPGQSLERISIDKNALDSDFETFEETSEEGYMFYGYGLNSYNTDEDWEPNAQTSATPGWGYSE